jgi:hypothetical protein
MKRSDYLAFGAAALLIVEFADWLASRQQAGALNATGARINPLTSQLSESATDLAAGLAETEGTHE